MSMGPRVCVVLLMLLMCLGNSLHADSRHAFDFDPLPALPVALEGACIGLQGEMVIIAGGTFEQDGVTQWNQAVHVLDLGVANPQWQQAAGTTAVRTGAACVSTPEGIICLGGSNAEGVLNSVVKLAWLDDKIVETTLPDLPVSGGSIAAATLGDAVYVVLTPNQTPTADAVFLRLNLAAAQGVWQRLETYPGPARLDARLVAQDGALYLLGGGANVGAATADAQGISGSGFVFRPDQGWAPMAEAPIDLTAVPLSAYGHTHILAFAGAQPGMDSAPIHAYHTITDRWTIMADDAPALKGATAVATNGAVVLVGPSSDNGGLSLCRASIRLSRSELRLLDWVVMALYFAAMLGMGLYFSRREKTSRDFFLGGRRVVWWAAGLSLFATGASSISYMAMPAKAYATDWIYLFSSVTEAAMMPMTLFVFIPLIRRLDISTAYEYLERRFNRTLRSIVALIFVANQAFARMGIVMLMPAIALSAVTGLNVYLCILMMGVLATIYTALGGIEAVIWTDVLQGFVMVGSALVCVGVVLYRLHMPIGDLVGAAQAAGKLDFIDAGLDLNRPTVWVFLIWSFVRVTGVMSDQNNVQRIQSTPTEWAAKKAVITHMSVAVPLNFVLFGLGTALFLFYRERPELLNPAMKTDGIFPFFVAQQLPMGISGLVIAGLFAASMSSLDSSVNSVSSVIVTDFYQRMRPESSERSRVILARRLTVALGAFGTAVALSLAYFDIKSAWDLFIKLTGLTLSCIAGIYVLAVFTKRATPKGAIVGAVVGTAVTIYIQNFTGISIFLYAAVGNTCCVIVGYCASLVLPGPSRDLDGLTIYTMKQGPKETART